MAASPARCGACVVASRPAVGGSECENSHHASTHLTEGYLYARLEHTNKLHPFPPQFFCSCTHALHPTLHTRMLTSCCAPPSNNKGKTQTHIDCPNGFVLCSTKGVRNPYYYCCMWDSCPFENIGERVLGHLSESELYSFLVDMYTVIRSLPLLCTLLRYYVSPRVRVMLCFLRLLEMAVLPGPADLVYRSWAYQVPLL